MAPAHENVNVEQAKEHLRKDPGLPIADPLPSLWQQPATGPVSDYQSSHLPQETDVAVIGSGITGASISKHLLEKDGNVKVTVLEARTLTSGATGRNGGHIMVIPELFYHGIKGFYGKEVAKEIIDFTIKNQDTLLGLQGTISPDLRQHSELRQLEILHVFTTEKTMKNAEERLETMNKELDTVKRSNRLVSKDELAEKYGIKNALGGATMLAGAVSPYRLITGIFSELLHKHSARFSIETNTPAEAITWDATTQRYNVQTPRGTIKAKQVVHATNAHVGHLVPSLRGFVHPLRCQVTVQEKHPDFVNQGSANTWCITYPGALESVYQSPTTGDLYVSGHVGMDTFFEEITPAENKNAPIDHRNIMANIMNDAFGRPVQGKTKANWTGIMGYTADGMPLIGKLENELSGREGNGEWIAAGFNGIGMVNAWLCGEFVAEGVLGKEDGVKIPSIYVPGKERVERADLGMMPFRSYAAWE